MDVYIYIKQEEEIDFLLESVNPTYMRSSESFKTVIDVRRPCLVL
jgi:hypothetical protein